MEDAEERLTQLEQCDCPRSCSVNGTVYTDGASWHSDCEVCSCRVSPDILTQRVIAIQITDILLFSPLFDMAEGASDVQSGSVSRHSVP